MLAALAALCAIAWAYLLYLHTRMPDGMASMPDMPMPMAHAWGAADTVSMFVMWAVMMVAMMLPSVTPMVLLYAGTVRFRAERGRPAQPVALFVGGYLLAWVGFSALATLANWLLHHSGLLSSMMGHVTAEAAATALIAAGVYQWTPLKDACLAHCRSPVGFLGDHWRDGRLGAIVMGMHHGAYCVGCCWLLMALLFVLGVMNLAWIAVLTLFVLIEKLSPWGRSLSRATGIGLIGWGTWLLVAAG